MISRVVFASLFIALRVQGETLLWSDEFSSPVDGSSIPPNPAVWSYELGNGNWGWGNGELQYYTSDSANVRVENDNLVIAVKDSLTAEGKRNFTSARINTSKGVLVKYCTVEARISVPTVTAGLWPAFWTLGQNFGTVSWPGAGEL
jgi:beta-glucanase (GH16 family)